MAILLLSGILFYPVLLQGQSELSCQHQVILYDAYGDGWNGSVLSLFVDGVIVLDSITLDSGAGPEPVNFEAETGQEITTIFECGSWCYECSYEITDKYGKLLASDGMGDSIPAGIPAGMCYANCSNPTFISENNPAIEARVFPNPCNDMLNIESGKGMDQLLLMDNIGRIVQSIELQNESTYSLDVSDLQPGIYFLRIETEVGRTVKRIIIE